MVNTGGKKLKRCLVLVITVLITAVFLATGCGGSTGGGPSISGKYVYKDAPASESPILDYKSDGTVVITFPAQVDPQTQQQTQANTVTWYYETSSELVKMWEDKEAMTPSPPYPYFLIYKDTLVDNQNQVMVKQGTVSEKVPASSTPSSTP